MESIPEAQWRINEFDGGLNTDSMPARIAPNEATILENLYFGKTGNLIKRPGRAKHTASQLVTDKPVHSMARFYKSDGTKITLAVCDGKLYKDAESDGTFTLLHTLDSNNPCTFAAWRGYIFISNGVDFDKYDGTTYSVVGGSPPKGRYIAYRKGRLWVAGVDANPGVVYYSDSGAPEVWGGGYIEVQQGDGNEVSGILAMGDELVVYKRWGIFVIAGNSTNDFIVATRTQDVGCSAPKTLVSFMGAHIFLHVTGVYLFDGYKPVRISENVNSIVEGIPAAYVSNAAGALHKNRYWLSYTPAGQTINQEILIYDPRVNGRWTKYLNINAACFCKWDGAGDSGELFCGDPVYGYIWKLETGKNDDGAAITVRYRSKFLSADDWTGYKAVTRFFVLAKPTNQYLSVIIKAVFEGLSAATGVVLSGKGDVYGTAVYGTAVYGVTDGRVYQKSIKAGTRGQLLTMELQESSTEEFELQGLGIFLMIESPNYKVLAA